jgi:hypothetical protein
MAKKATENTVTLLLAVANENRPYVWHMASENSPLPPK